MNINAEIRQQLDQLNQKIEIVEVDRLTDILETTFSFKGSKIDWSKTVSHQYRKYDIRDSSLKDILAFVKQPDLYEYIQNSEKICYLNDGQLDFGLSFSPDAFFEMVQLLLKQIPTHHYFFSASPDWCLAITMEGDMDFSLAPEKVHE
ncbi:MAG: hypothetical protein LBR25_04165 [Erysipelotrichaceae bacterium]|jgi:hypothetical protein|nr:hypothetical protein [Erysipelotrichaceae bacterium]